MAGLRWLLHEPLGDIAPYITFYPAIILSALVGGMRAGALSVALSAAITYYFFLPPYLSWTLKGGTGLSLALFLAVGATLVLLVALLNNVVDAFWRQSESIRLVLEAQPAGIIAVDGQGKIRLVNAAVEKLFGYTRDELLGQPIELLVPQEARDRHLGFRNKYLDKPEPRKMGVGRDLHGVTRDGGQVPVEVGLNSIERGGRSLALATVVDISERKATERRQEVLVNEVQHRARNLMAIVQVLIQSTLKPGRSLEESREILLSRLRALARVQDEFMRAGEASLAGLVRSELAPFDAQAAIAGDDFPLNPRSAQNLTLILHELTSNAAKYGALSVPDGKVSVHWTASGGVLAFRWSEQDGPPVAAPSRRGFGQVILKDVAREMASNVNLDYRPSGLVFEMDCTLTRILARPGEATAA